MSSDGQYVTLELAPTVNKDDTQYKAEGQWVDSNLITFSSTGRISRFLGWALRSAQEQIIGVARAIHIWKELEGRPHYITGSNEKLQIEQLGTTFDITPVESTVALTDAISTTDATSLVSIADVSHGRNVGDWVLFDSVAGDPVGGITFAGIQGYVVTITDADNYIVEVDAVATSTVAASGGAISLSYLYPSGRQSTGVAYGFGAGTYGTPGETATDGWGDPRGGTGLSVQLRQWSVDNWGEDALALPRGGPLYTWDATNTVNTRAQIVATAPAESNVMFVHPNRHCVLLGTIPVGGADLDPLEIRWSDRDDYTDFVVTANNRAGTYRLQGSGNEIVGYAHSRRETIIFTDDSVWAMTPANSELVFGFNQIATNAGLIAQQAAIDVDGIVYWMSFRNFYRYDGVAIAMSTDIEDFVFDDMNFQQRGKIFCGVNKVSEELIWLYQSKTSATGDVDKYVKHNWSTGSWDVGHLDRTVWADSGIFTNPIAISSDGDAYDQNTGYTYPGVGNMSSYIESSYFDIQDGTDVLFIDQLLPDLDLGGPINFYITTRKWPNGDEAVKGPYVLTPTSTSIPLRSRGRQAKVKFEVSDDNVSWSLGKPLYRIKKDGQR